MSVVGAGVITGSLGIVGGEFGEGEVFVQEVVFVSSDSLGKSAGA